MPINNSKINISRQMEFIREHGEWLNYSRGMKCTCTQSIMIRGSNLPDPNRANPNCKACGGLGWVWLDGGRVLGVIENIQQHKDLLMAGIAAPGDLVMSPDLRYTLADYDKIQLTWKEGIPFEGQLITRSSGTTDQAFYGIMSVDMLATFDYTNGTTTEYKEGVDFTIAASTGKPDKLITWLTGRGPSSGTVYSVKYQALADWIVFTPPQPRRERGTNLGQRIILKKKHLVFNGM